MTHAPGIDCHGTYPYIMHGVLGFEILKENGFHTIAKIAERHTGAGLSSEEIKQQGLPLPVRDMLPINIEEKIIAFADKFFSKGHDLTREKTIHEIKNKMKAFGQNQEIRFQTWCDQKGRSQLRSTFLLLWSVILNSKNVKESEGKTFKPNPCSHRHLKIAEGKPFFRKACK
jgi:hypothetical protein